MAISPKDLALTEKEVKEVEQYEHYIDGDLKAAYVAGRKITVDFSRRAAPSDRVRNELVRRYTEAGWARIEISWNAWTFFPT